MSDNAVLDVAIGLIGMFICLSLLCTVINELIATVLKLRATTLADGIKKLIDDNALRTAFAAHGLVRSAQAAAGEQQPSYLPGRDFAMALLGSLDPAKPLKTMQDVEAAINSLPQSRIRDALMAHTIAADGKLDRLRSDIARWFDESMDRVSGVYKRKLKVIALIVGVLVALAFNADSIRVYKLLWHDSSLRATAVARASDLVDPTSSVPQRTTSIRSPRSAPDPALAVDPAANAPHPSGDLLTVTQLNNIEDSLRPLPIGWTASEWNTPENAASNRSIGWQVLSKIAGLLVTVLAISLGAPFWFDVLSRVTNIRGSGAKPQRTPAS